MRAYIVPIYLIASVFFIQGGLNPSAFIAGMIEAVLNGSNFPAKVSAHWHNGTTFMIKFDESVIQRDKMVDGK